MSHPKEVQRAVFGLLTAMLVVDGETDDAELARVVGHAKRHPLFAGLTDKDLSALLRSGLAEIRANGAFATFARWAVAVPADLAEPTFELIVKAMLADGVYREKEGALGDALREALKIPSARAAEITDRVLKASGN